MNYEYDWFKPFEDADPDQEAPARPTPYAVACKRHSVLKVHRALPTGLPSRFTADLEQNQQIASCCRHPENHEIEAWYSNAEHKLKGIPDIYIFHCFCGRQHPRLMCGGGQRPFWDIR